MPVKTPPAKSTKRKIPNALQKLVDQAKAEPTPKILGGILKLAVEVESGMTPATLTDNGAPISFSAPFGQPTPGRGERQPPLLEPEDVQENVEPVHDPKFDNSWGTIVSEAPKEQNNEEAIEEGPEEEEDPFADLSGPTKAEPEEQVVDVTSPEPPAEPIIEEESEALQEPNVQGMLEEMAEYRKENQRLREQIEIIASRNGSKKALQELQAAKEENARLLSQNSAKDSPASTLTLPVWKGKDVRLLFPCYKQSNPATTSAIIALMLDFGSEKIGYFCRMGDAMIYHARNILADDFMKSGAQWAFWLDDDIVPPVGRPDFTRMYIGASEAEVPDKVLAVHVIHRLMSHNQKLIGGTYFGRRKYSPAMFHEGITNQGAYLKAKNVSGEVLPTEWVATGCMLVHRDVFLGIQKACPELAPNNKGRTHWDYFLPGSDGDDSGEDKMFCRRAKKAGIQTYVDTGVQCFHVGNQAFGYYNTTNQMPAAPNNPNAPRPWWK